MTGILKWQPPRWYHSFYWRIAVSFVVLVVVVLVAQSLMFRFVMARGGPFPGRSPNSLAAIIAADVGSALTQQPSLDLQGYIEREYGRVRFPLFVVMKGGGVATNSSEPLPEGIRQPVDAALGGIDFSRTGGETATDGPAVVMAPIQVGGELRGMVVLPPRDRGSPFVQDLSRIVSVPGTLVLIVATAVATIFIFGPARRRLRALEDATDRLAAGDLTARAAESGSDEVTRVARAFNRMTTELAARDAAVRTADHLRRQLLADVSHELKTPLTTMRGYLETLQMPEVELDEGTRQRYLETIGQETLRLERIVRDLLDLARLEGGGGTLAIRVFSVERLFERVIRRYEREAAGRGVAIHADVAPGAGELAADPDRIEQVIDNLVANALRHTPAGGRIELRASTAGGATTLAVGDSGEGIPPGHVAHVFERFYKAGSAREGGTSGSGLGLSIAKAIVERHGGSIEVASEPGRTVFSVTLPNREPGPQNVS